MKIFSKGLQGLSSFKKQVVRAITPETDQGSYMKYLSNSFTEVVKRQEKSSFLW